MNFIYDTGIRLYSLAVKTASPFNHKAKLFSTGRKNILERIKKEVKSDSPIIWFHCSSVGEFEQARPIIEWYKENNSQYKILITFFSPSGYELRKNYELADWVFYLPVDTYSNAKRFVNTIKPDKAIFIKYEFWYNYLLALKETKTKVYIISAIFRPTQLFFKWYGAFFRNMLSAYTHLFVQDSSSAQLLEKIGIKNNVTISGDTRFDRVYKITQNTKEFPLIKKFSELTNSKVGIKENFTIIAGSSWGPDEALLVKVLENFSRAKLILAPHEITPDHIEKIEKLFAEFKPIRFSSFDNKFNEGKLGKFAMTTMDQLDYALTNSRVLIIDCIGILSSIYKYGQIAYIGGGFGVGIHNILEAATYGIPIIFGPNYNKFKEAKDLIKLSGANSIDSYLTLYNIIDKYINHKNVVIEKGDICKNYVINNIGATESVVKAIEAKN